MNRLLSVGLAGLVFVATAAAAHNGVKNPAVKARMHAMDVISENMKTIGKMAQRQVTFDADAARAAVDEIALQAAQIPSLFEAQETDPKSEAKPEIWTNWDDFVAQSNALNSAAQGVDASSPDALGRGLATIGGTCRSCHMQYRT